MVPRRGGGFPLPISSLTLDGFLNTNLHSLQSMSPITSTRGLESPAWSASGFNREGARNVPSRGSDDSEFLQYT